MGEYNQTEYDLHCPATRDPGDTGWLLSCAVTVMTMQGGFALLESGSVRINNSVNILIKNFFDLAFGAVTFWALGWGFLNGQSAGGFVGTTEFFPSGGIDYAAWFFNFSFAATASTIDSGACAERMKLAVYVGLSAFTTTFVYPVAAHWIWNEGGWLYQLGFIDLAGVTVVHALGGASALVCTVLLGPRMGWFGRPVAEEIKCVEESLMLSYQVFKGEPIHLLFGSLLLLFGWIAFNAGSSLGLTENGHLVAAHVAFTTVLAGCTGTISSSFAGYRLSKKHQLYPSDIASGLLGGLVSITGGAHVVTAATAVMVGAVGGVFTIVAARLLARWNVDDPVGVVNVHLFAAIIGTLVPGFFATTPECAGFSSLPHEGLLYSGDPYLLGVQTLGLVVISTWGAFWAFAYLMFVDRCITSIRVSPIEELVGNDVVEHGVDVFKRLKHTHKMQKMMAQMNPVRTTMSGGPRSMGGGSSAQSAASHISTAAKILDGDGDDGLAMTRAKTKRSIAINSRISSKVVNADTKQRRRVNFGSAMNASSVGDGESTCSDDPNEDPTRSVPKLMKSGTGLSAASNNGSPRLT